MATIRKAPGGWRAEVRLKGAPKQSKTLRTKAAVTDWARKTEDDIRQGIYIDRSAAEKMTVAKLLKTYQRDITRRKKSASKENSRIGILTTKLGAWSLAALTPERVIEYVDGRKVAPDTVRKELQTLGHAIDTAMAMWNVSLPANPVTTAKRILRVTRALEAGQHRDRRVSDEELGAITARLRPVPAAAVVFMVETAVRRGELCRIRREHTKDKILSLPGAITKTGKPRRIPLSQRAQGVLESLPARIDGLAFGLKPDSLTQAFSRASRAAGIHDLRIHDLRHEATSRLFERGLSVEEVASITGHSDWRSLKRYTHPDAVKIAAKL